MSLQENIKALELENKFLRSRLEKADQLNTTLLRENLLAKELIQVYEINIGNLQGQIMMKNLINS